MPDSNAWPDDVRKMCNSISHPFDVAPDVHIEDFIFRFVFENPVFPSKESAINYYFSDGRNSAQKVRAALDRWLPARPEPYAILEFASGYGAVTRHAKKTLAPNTIHSSDIHPQANQFLTDKFGVKTVQSCVRPEDFKFDVQYDMIFVLSFFSHMPKTTWLRWLSALYSGLKAGGVLLFTTHGGLSLKYFPQATLDKKGYWFTQSSEQGDLDVSSYGQAVTLKQFVDEQIATLPLAEHLLYEQGGWWNHQDLFIIRKSNKGD